MCADWAVSIRRACGALRFDCSSYHYKSRRTDPAELKRRIKEICETRVRYGYRRVHVILKREGWNVSIKKVYSVYRTLGLQLRNKTPKRRVKAKLRDDRAEAAGPNNVWAMDFVHDQLAWVGSCGSSPSSTRIPAIVRQRTSGSSIAGRTWSRPSKGSAARSATRRRSGSTTSYVGKDLLLEASDHGTSERPDTLKMVAQAGSATALQSGLLPVSWTSG